MVALPFGRLSNRALAASGGKCRCGPLAALGLPLLLAPPGSATAIPRLEALQEWTRSLAGVLTVGTGLEQAIIVTARSAPAAIRPQVAGLAGRLAARTPTDVALHRFADDLADPTGDLIVTSLLLGAARRGQGERGHGHARTSALAAATGGRAAASAGPATARRAPEAVARDRRLGLVTDEGAARDYGAAVGQAVPA